MAETAAQAERRRQAAAIESLEEELLNFHLDKFPLATQPKAKPPEPVDEVALRKLFAAEAELPKLEAELAAFGSPPVAPAPEVVDGQAMIRDFRKRAMREVPLVRFAERRQARADATAEAEAEIAAENRRRSELTATEQDRLDSAWEKVVATKAEVERKTSEAVEREKLMLAEQHQAEQADLDRDWAELLDNNPAVVRARLVDRLSGWTRSRPGEVLDAVCGEGDEAMVTVLFEHPADLIPEQRADRTAAGRPTVRKRSQTDRNELYFSAMSSVVLALARYACASAPGLERVSIFVVRREQKGRLAGQIAPIYFGTFRRDEDSLTSNYPGEAADHAGALVEIGGRTDEVLPVDIAGNTRLEAALGRASLASGPSS